MKTEKSTIVKLKSLENICNPTRSERIICKKNIKTQFATY
jgi:hypothetical protein